MNASAERHFIESFKLLLKTHGKSSAAFARMLEITPSALSHNLKKLATTRNYDSKFPGDVARALSLSIDELSYKLTEGHRGAAIITDRFIDQKLKRLADAQDPYIDEIKNLFKNLRSGDCYTFVTTEQPMEYEEDPDFRKSIVDAVQRGVVIRYVFPDPEDPAFARQFRLYREIDDTWERLEKLHGRFLEVLQGEYDGVSSKHLPCIKSNDPFLLNPLMKIMLITYSDRPDQRAFVEHKTGRHDMPATVRHWYPLPPAETLMIAKAIGRLTQE
jgi:predicted transcriptional regulator